MPSTVTRYDDWPEHPLHDLPADAVDAARAAVTGHVTAGHLDAELGDPVADALVTAVTEWVAVTGGHRAVAAVVVPAEIRLAAYQAMSGAVDWHDITADDAFPLADDVIVALSPWLDWPGR